nr:hypothetical protein [Variovorax paradoxus]
MAGAAFDPGAAGAEYAQHLPSLAELFEAEHPGMHTTDSIDYDSMLDGEIWLELDDGAMSRMSRMSLATSSSSAAHAMLGATGAIGQTTIAFVLIGACRA